MFIELPWDEPNYGCAEYCDWKDCKITLSPWNKVDNLALCKSWTVELKSPIYKTNLKLPKGVIRRCKSKKNRQYNDQKK